MCASPLNRLVQLHHESSNNNHGEASKTVTRNLTPVASGEKVLLQFRMLDIFNNSIRLPSTTVTASLHGNTSSSVRMRSGENLNLVYSDHNGIYSFDEFSLLGSPGSAAKVDFSPQGASLCEAIPSVPISSRFRIASCLPSYTHMMSSGVCEPCPARTYQLLANQSECRPCSEEVGSSESSLDSYSCLISPEFRESHHNDDQRRYEIEAGFYPSPSLEAPTDLLKCPNHACLSFECIVRLVSEYPKQHNIALTRFFLPRPL